MHSIAKCDRISDLAIKRLSVSGGIWEYDYFRLYFPLLLFGFLLENAEFCMAVLRLGMYHIAIAVECYIKSEEEEAKKK